MGKSGLLYNLAHQLVQQRQGIGVVDVHGDLTKELERALWHLIPDKVQKQQRVTILDPTRGAFGFNPLQIFGAHDPYPYILELQSLFKKLWADAWGERMGDILRNSCLVLAEKGLTLCELPRLLTDAAFRSAMLGGLKNRAAKEYFELRFNKLPKQEQAVWIESTLNKVSNFTGDPLIRDIVGQRRSTINFRRIIDTPGAVLLIRLPKGILKENAFLLGALLISKIQEAALSRTDIPLDQRRKFTLMVDEFQHFGAKSLNFQECLSEAQKYGLSLVLAHQNIDQIDQDLLTSILGNTDCQISFRISRRDAEVIAKEIFRVDVEELQLTDSTLAEKWEEFFNALTQLKPRQAYVVFKGRRSHLMATITKPSYNATDQQLREQAELLMRRYCRPREEIRQEQERRAKEFEALGEPRNF